MQFQGSTRAQIQGEHIDANDDHLLLLQAQDEDQVTRSIPGFAIALTGHALLLLIAAFIVYVVPVVEELVVLDAQMEMANVPPLPDPPVIDNEPVPVEELEVENPVINPQVSDVVTQADAINPTKDPLNAETADTPAESPNLSKNPNSAIGFGASGGGAGGGTGGGGPGPFGERGPEKRRIPDVNVDGALQWLADHQARDGSWRADRFHEDSIRFARGAVSTRNIDFNDFIPKDSDIGWDSTNVGLTGLSLLAFAGAGYTWDSPPKDGIAYGRVIKRAIRWLLMQQNAEGMFAGHPSDEAVYNHAIVTMALAECYGMAPLQALKKPVQDGIDWIVRAQNPGRGWRYGVQDGQNDTSVTAWMVLALKSAALCGFKLPQQQAVYEGANEFLDDMLGMGEGDYEVTGYRTPGLGASRLSNAKDYHRGPSMDACNLMVRLFTGVKFPRTPHLTGSILKDLPEWYQGGDESNGPWKIDMYYWYYASLAIFQIGGGAWEKWEAHTIRPVLMQYQRGWHPKDKEAFGPQVSSTAEAGDEAGRWILDEHGSWDPVGAWGTAGGRVYATAINCLTLEVYYRYRRITESEKAVK